jgi:hypothetical protein
MFHPVDHIIERMLLKATSRRPAAAASEPERLIHRAVARACRGPARNRGSAVDLNIAAAGHFLTAVP